MIQGIEYCAPYMANVIASLVLARHWDAHCLFSDRAYLYLKYMFGSNRPPRKADHRLTQAFHSVFEAYLPNSQILPHYLLAPPGSCETCQNERKCKDNHMRYLEENVRKLLEWRSYDEIREMKSVVWRIASRRNKHGGIDDPQEVKREIQSIERRLKHRVRAVFPKVKRWASITTMASIPMAIVGTATDSVPLKCSAIALAGVSTVAKELVAYLQSKYSWTGFRSRELSADKSSNR